MVIRVSEPVLADALVRLRGWALSDAEWYADTAAHDELIQRFTSEPPRLTLEQVRAAFVGLAGRDDAAGFLICDPVSGQRWGNIAVEHRDGIGHVSYWLAGSARGRGVATCALRLFSRWILATLPVTELTLWTHAENTASRAVAERVGFVRDPDRDQPRQIKGILWHTVAYRLTAGDIRGDDGGLCQLR